MGGVTSTSRSRELARASHESRASTRRSHDTSPGRDDGKGARHATTKAAAASTSHDELPRAISPRERARILGVKRDTALTLSRRSQGKGLPMTFDQKNMLYFRHHIALEIWEHEMGSEAPTQVSS